jgi:hypothetical protein
MPQQFQHHPEQRIPQVMCPQCGVLIGLSVIEPAQDGKLAMRFSCSCGFEYEMSSAAQDEHRLD